MSDVPISDIVNVSISIATGATQQAGFGTIMIVGQTNLLGSTVLTCSSALDWVTAGGLTTDPEYLALAAIFSQQPTVQEVKVSERDPDVSGQQRVTFAADITAGQTCTITYTYVDLAGATQTETVAILYAVSHANTVSLIEAALLALNAVTACTGVDDTPGALFTVTIDPALVRSGSVTFTVMATAGAGVPQTGTASVVLAPTVLTADLNALVLVDDAWYCLILTHEGTDNQRNMDTYRAAVWVEANTIDCIHIAQNDQAVLAAGTAGNIAKVLEAASYNRTHVFYHPESEYAAAALAGRNLSQNLDVSSIDWYLQTLSGITSQDYTSTQRSTMAADQIGYYTTAAGGAHYFGGKMASQRYIDQQLTVDWFSSRVAEDVLSYLVRGAASNIKRTYTDLTIAAIAGLVKKRWINGVRANHFAETREDASGDTVEGIILTAGSAASQSSADKTARLYAGLSASIPLAGGIRTVNPLTIILEV